MRVISILRGTKPSRHIATLSFSIAIAALFTISCEEVITPYDEKFGFPKPWVPDTSGFMYHFGTPQEGWAVQQTADGGYIVAGMTALWANVESTDILLIKTDAAGNLEWSRTIGGDNHDYPRDMALTQDGGFVVVGGTYSFGAVDDGDVYLAKMNSAGEIEWTQTFGGAGFDLGRSIDETSDNGFIITGIVHSNPSPTNIAALWLIRTDAMGQLVWEREFGGPGLIRGFSTQQTSEGGFIVVGDKQSERGSSDYDILLIKLDELGNTTWTIELGDSLSSDHGSRVRQLSDLGYIILGNIGTAVSFDVTLTKVDAEGNVLWEKILRSDAQGYDVRETDDGGFIVGGYANIPEMDSDLWFLKTNAVGDIEWSKTFGDSLDDRAHAIQLTTDGGYIAVGNTYSSTIDTSRQVIFLDRNIWLVKTGASGDTSWTRRFFVDADTSDTNNSPVER